MSTFVIAVDGSEGSTRAALYATEQARQQGGEVKVIHVLQWSPYSFLTPEELEERHMRREKELERAKSAIIEPILQKLKEQGFENATGEVRYGNVPEIISKFASESGDAQIFVGRQGKNNLATRMFGTVPSVLVQISNVPVTVVP